jgi:hypothetical protein
MAQVWKVRLPNGNVVTPGEWTSAVPLWSVVEVGTNGFQNLRAFSYGQSGTVPGSVGPRQATLIDTNLQGEGNRLPENEELIIHTVGVELFKIGAAASVAAFPDSDNPGVPLPDMLRMQRDVTMQINIAAIKNYTHSPISYWPAGTGPAYTVSGGRSFVSAAAPNGEIPANNGMPSVTGRRELASELHVAGGETFYVEFTPGPGQVNNLNLATTARIRVRTFLDGYRRRPVA